MKLDRPIKQISDRTWMIELLMRVSAVVILLGYLQSMLVKDFKANRILEFGVLALMALTTLDLLLPRRQRRYENWFLYILLAACVTGLTYLGIMSYL